MDKCEQEFNKLKQLLMTTSILKELDMDRGFLVCTSASIEGLDTVLMQEVGWFPTVQGNWDLVKIIT